MTESEVEVIGTDIFWRASKNKSYRDLIRDIFRTMATFLQSNGLTTRELLPDGAEIDEKFVIRRSDLTEEGYAFYRRVERKWFAAIDRGVSPAKSTVLEKELRALRREASPKAP